MDFDKDPTLQEWTREQPLSVLALDSADRAVLRIADERDAVQKKTFTKWVNKHLKKANRQIRDLFEDLRDGHNLISLLEVLTGEQLPRERGKMRFHMLHNIDTALHFLHCKKIKLVNIRSEDIVDGNPKLTLGLIWTIILHFQISDIVVGQEPNVSAKDYLLRWAKRTTHKYPGVRVQDFTKSWRDGLAFSAIIHRNRPDLLDWRQATGQRARERMETAFYIAEREYGVTRLLDPEDVDTHEPDEKSLITYISSLHEVFPEPPSIHPLYDSAAQQRVTEYRELASALHQWMREKYTLMQDRSFPPTLIEMKKLAAESSRFRTDEIPPRNRDKNYLNQMFRDLEKYFKTVGEVDLEPELHIDKIERNWSKLMAAYQDRDRHILEELKRLEKLQRLAEKVHREIKQTDSGLDIIERTIENESRRIERMHPLEAKKIADQLDQDLAVAENNIQGLFTDVNTLKNGRYPQAGELQKRVDSLDERWVRLKKLQHIKILQPLANLSFPVEERTVTKHVRTVQETRNVDTNPHFRSLQEYIEWCKNKLKQLKKADFGTDLPSVQAERDFHVREHKQIDQFHSKVESSVKARQYFQGEELTLYNQHLGQLQKVYADLLSFSTNRMTDLDTLLDFIQSASRELQWLEEKAQIETDRDWSDVNLNADSVEQYYENLMNELEKREIQFTAVLERGECLVIQNHPATKAVEAHIAAMNAEWAWLLQLTHCLETHLNNTRVYQKFYKDVEIAEEWLKEKDDVMNSEFSQGDFSLDVGERLLQGMQALKDELNAFGDQVQALIARANDVAPLKQRRQPVTRPLSVVAVCNYKQNNFVIEKNKQATLTDNSGRTKWKVHNDKGHEAQIPGVCFVIPPPDKESIETAERLRRQFDRSIALWQKKQMRMRQNMIFATIKVVKGWDLPQFIAIGAEQRNAIRRALNEDADKLMAEGDPKDPQLKRLRREMDDVNRLFDELERRARAEEESKNQARIFNQQVSGLQQALDEAERVINKRVAAALPRDVDTLQHLVLEHKEFESRLQNLEPEIEQVKDTFRSITLKTPQHKKDLEKVLDKWKYIWNTSNLYIERLKCIEIVLNGMEDATQVISEFESKLAMFKELPSTEKGLEVIHDDLLKLQSAVGQQQIAMDQLNDDFDNTRRLTEKSRPNQRGPHSDVERLDKEIQKLNNRWSNVCAQLADRLRGCEQAYNLLKQYKKPKDNEDAWLDEQYGKLENLQPIKDRAKEHLEATRNLLNSVCERAPIIEQVNVNGGKFIREGKIWSKGLQRFREALVESQPSLDVEAAFRNNAQRETTGADVVARELDEFNARYQYLMDCLYGRLQEIAARCPGDIVTLRLVEQMQPPRFRTFRSEFHMSSASELTSSFTTTTHYSKQYLTTRNGTSVTTISDSSEPHSDDQIDNVHNGRPPDGDDDKNDKIYTTRTQITPPQTWSESMQFSEIKSLKRVHKSVTGTSTDITELPGIVNPFNGAELLSIREAITTRVLDVRSGTIMTRDEHHVTINEALQLGLIDPKVGEALQSPCGLIDEQGQDLTLLQAIQRQIYEAEHGGVDSAEKRLKVLTTPEPTALKHTEVKLQTGPMSLSDAIAQGLIDDKTGWIVDRNTGNKYQIDAAVRTNVLDGDVREIADCKSDRKITLLQALDAGLINPKLGKFIYNHDKLSFGEAKRRLLIAKPKTLKDLADEGLIDDQGLVQQSAPLSDTKVTLTEAVGRGILDYDQIKSILDFQSQDLLTLKDAITSNIIDETTPRYTNSVTGETMPVPEAVSRGFIISVSKKSVFDVDAFQVPAKNEHISFNAAVAKGYISQKAGGSLVTSLKSGKLISFAEALETGDVKPEVYELLHRPIGIFGADSSELSVLQAVFAGHIDPKTGNLMQGDKVVYLNEAIAGHLITPEGASLLNSLLNLNVSTQLTRTLVRRYVTVIKKPSLYPQITYTEALRSGLIDNESQTFIDRSTNHSMPIVQAISDGLLAPDSRSSVVVTSEPPSEGWSLFEAINRKLFDPQTGLFTIPGTDRLTSLKECIDLKLIDPASALVVDPANQRKLSLVKSLDKKILDDTGHYSTERLTLEEAITRGYVVLQHPVLVTEVTSAKPEVSTTRPEVNTIRPEVATDKFTTAPGVTTDKFATPELTTDQFATPEVTATVVKKVVRLIAHRDPDEPTEGEKARARVTTEPTYQVKIGRAQSLSPDREAKKVVLQKLRKRIVKPKDAVAKGIIDEETARILNDSPSNATLQELIDSQIVDGNRGTIIDPQRGTSLTINEAITRGLLDPEGPTNELLVPLNRSLSIPELVQQGLIDLESHKVVHPETGAHLKISEAIVCDIVDPLSTLNEGRLTLESALQSGVVNDEHSTVDTANGNLTIVEAVRNDVVFDHTDSNQTIPPAGMTFQVALKRGLVDPATSHILNPLTNERLALEDAINRDFLMSLPSVGVSEHRIGLQTALEAKLIDHETSTFTNPVTGDVIPVSEAFERGILVTRPEVTTSGVVTTTQTVNTIHTVTTKSIELLGGYILLNTGQVQKVETGEVIPADEARKRGIIIDEQQSKNVTTVKDVERSLADVNVPIKNLNVDTIYDEATHQFVDPDHKAITFKEAIDRQLIDPQTVVYDTKAQEPVTVQTAIDRGLIDQEGNVVTEGRSVDFKEAAKKGLIAVLGGLALPVVAPVLAVKAIKDYVQTPKPRKVEITIVKNIIESSQQDTTTKTKTVTDYDKKLPIGDAIGLDLIDPKTCRVEFDGKHFPFTVEEGLRSNKLSPIDLVEIIDRRSVILVDQPPSALFAISKAVTPAKLAELGYYDLKTRKFIDPQTGDQITFETLIYDTGLFNPQTILVKDLTTKPPTYVTMDEAFRRPLIDKHTGYMVDPKTGKRVPFFEAVKLRWIIHVDDRPRAKYQPLSIEEIVDNPTIFDPVTVQVTQSGEKISLLKAVVTNVVDPKSVTIRDEKNKQLVPYYEAVDRQIVDPQRGLVIDTETHSTTTFKEAFERGHVRSLPRPVTLEAVIAKGHYKDLRIVDPITKRPITVREAIERLVVDDKISEVKDTSTDQYVTLDEALRLDLVQDCQVVDKVTGQLVPLDSALDRGLIRSKPLVFNLLQALISNYYLPKSGRVLNPITGEEITLQQAIEYKLVDPVTTRIKDSKRGRIVELNEAIKTGLVDPVKGCLNDPALPLDQAYLKGYILSTVLPWSLQETLAQKVYDPQSGLFKINDSRITLVQAIEGGIVNPNMLTVKEPRSGDIITLNDAINLRIIDPVKGQAYDPVSDTTLNLYEAQNRGLIVPYKSQITLPEAVFKGFYDPATGKFINPKSKERLKAASAINRGYVDTSSTLVTIDEEIVTFEQAIVDGYIDTVEGTVISSRHEPLDFNEAFERGLLVEIRPPVSLSEALIKGLYDEDSQLFLDPQSSTYITLIEAIEVNLIDPDSVSVKDTKSGVWRKIPLVDAIHSGYVDPNTGNVRDFSQGDNVEVTLPRAFDLGILVDNRAAVSLQRALHQGLYDEATGKVIDGDRNITLHEAIRKFIINPLLPLYYDRNNRLVNLTEACRLGIVDKRKGTFKDPTTGQVMSLVEAMDRGLIVDIETANFGLFEALQMDLYLPDEGLFVHPSTGRKMTLKDACTGELINPLVSLVKNSKTSRYVTLPEAIEAKIIDEEVGVFKLPHGQTITLTEAKAKGLIVTNRRQLTLEEAIKMGLYRPDSGKFADPLTNEFWDLQQSFDNCLLDPATTGFRDSLAGGVLRSLPQAIQDGRIEIDKGRVLDSKTKQSYKYGVALDKGLLVTLDKPLALEAVVKKSVVDLSSRRARECTLDEAIKFELLDPLLAVARDPSGKFTRVRDLIDSNQWDASRVVTFEPPRDDLIKSQVVVYDHTIAIFLREPLSFAQALELRKLDPRTGKFLVDESASLSLKDSIALGFIDPDSVLVKDLSRKRLIKLPEGFRKGLIDAEKGNVLDTITSKLHTMPSALDSGLLITPARGFSLTEAIVYGLYNPTTGGFTCPFTPSTIINRRRLTLRDAIDDNLVDPSGTVVKREMEGGVVSLLSAIDGKIVDAIGGTMRSSQSDDKVDEIDLVKAHERGLILPAEQRQAVEEKYKLCDETLSKLLQWIAEVEEKIATQDVIHEVEEELRNQINVLKQVRDDLEQHSGPVAHCGDQVRQLVLTAGDVLSKSEVSALEKSGRNLKTRYDKSVDRCDKLLRKMTSARDELTKLKKELTSFSEWLGKARRVLEDKERALSDLKHLDSSADSTKAFVSDVIAHQADLRFITMSAQKFVDEGKDYLAVLNEFRTSLPSRLHHIEPLASQDSPVRSEVSLVTQQYRDLYHRANNLVDRLSGVGGRQREYSDALDKARMWLRDAEPRALKVLNEPIAGDPKAVEDQLHKAKAINNEFVANGRLIDGAKQATESLLNSLQGQISPSEMSRLEQPVLELDQKYTQLSSALAERCQELDIALVQSQGVQDALDGIITWLNSAENQFKNMQKPASLIKERLDEQLREHRVFQSEIDTHVSSIDSVYLSASELIASSSNTRVAKKIETKLNDVKARFDKLFDRTVKRGEFLEDVNKGLTVFIGGATQFDQWYTGIVEMIESREFSTLTIDEYSRRMREIAVNRDEKRPLYEEVVKQGKELLNKRDVTDTAGVRDRVKTMENQWRELDSLLDEKQKLSKLRSEQLSAYESLREQVTQWLTRFETRVTRLETVAVDIDTLKKQSEELKPIAKEYKDYGATIDKVNDIGNAYDNLIRGDRPDSPSRRKGYSPTKRAGRRPSQELSPLSPSGGSSGFSSRRSSQDGFHLDELSPVQQQLAEINNRYSLLGVKINDRQSEIESLRDEVKKHLDNLKALSAFLDKVQRQLPKDVVPATKEESDKLNKQVKQLLEEMYEKQSLLDSTKSQVKDLLRRKPGALGADSLNDQLEDVVSHWKTLSDHLKNRIKFMEDMKEFLDTHDSLSSWLSSKDRMLTVLGPISSDSRMVQSQVQQVQVLREEFRSQQPQLQHLIDVGDSVLNYLDPRSPDGQKVNDKLGKIQQRWADLLGKLEERAESLGAAADTSREFDAQLTRLRDALQGIADNLDELPLDKDPEEQLRKVENLERQLEGQRPLLADLEAAGAHLCDVLSDPASRADIQAKLAQIGRQYNALQKKLDHKKAELEGSLRDGRQFEASCAKTLGWLSDELGSLSERLLVSAIRDVLEGQLAHHEPIYRDVLAREHEVIMLLNKGRDVVARNNRGDSRTLQRDLDKIQQQWDKLRKETADRHTRLQTCNEHCRKYYKVLETFLPWLRQAEDKLDTLRPSSFQRKLIEKQLKELQNFRNEVWKKSGEYENTKSLGDTFLSACDVDKDVVKGELGNLKERWDRLNNDLIERTQALEDQARKLQDFNENVRDLQHGLERCEDKLASHDALGGAARDPKLLERIKALREETAQLKKPLQGVKQQAHDLVDEASRHGIDAHHLEDEVDGLGDRINDLQAKLEDRCSDLQSAATAVTQFNDQVKTLGHDLSGLESELDNMKAPGRDFKTVRGQIEEVAKLLYKINKASDDVNDAIAAGERLVDSGFAPDTAQTRQQVEGLRKQLGKLDDRARSREQNLNDTLKKLEDFYVQHANVLDDIHDADDQLRKLKPVGSEVDSIRAQQQDFKKLRAKTVEPLGKVVDNCNRIGQGLIQSAGSGVNTAILEKDLERMNEQWNDLKQRLNDRERRLDVALLQSGKFQEALDGLAKWLTDTEELVANQKPPSADYKVVKAQLQEQKFLKKMLLDRQNSMSSLFGMGNEIAKEAEPAERKAIEKQLKSLIGRFDALTEGAQQRTLDLEQAMKVAKEFQDKLVPLQEWLDRSEKKIKDMEVIPTDEEKIHQKIREHEALHSDILSKKPDFRELTDIASNLMSLVGEDEASALADKLQEVTDRYGNLVETSERVGQLLAESRQGLRHLVITYQDLAAWMDAMEHRLNRFKVLAVHTDKLLEQMDDLTNLTQDIANRQNDVDGTVDSGVELMRHISSDEALQLKDKLDSLQRRYNDLTSRGADLLKHAEDMLPLVQQFHNHHNRLVDWMQGAESVLQSAEPHEGDIARLEVDLQELRPVLENINLLGPQLCQASPGEGAATIEGLVTRDNRRFDAIAEQIQRRAERIHLGKQRALEVTGDIDELLEWFREVESQIRDAEKPSAEPDLIRVQLKEHKALNDDISSQKGRVRDVLSTAKKVLRESPPSEDTSLIREKMEDLRETMDTVSALSSDRLGILEQALPLAEHFNDTHQVIANWLSDIEEQISMLAMPALRPDLIAQQQDRNEMFLQSINDHKPLLDKLNKTGEALIRLCNDDDGSKVQELLESDNARYAALRLELRERQQALEQALQESSQFSDKLEGMLRALSNTADQVNNQEPISAHPPKIRDQIEDNDGLINDLDKRKEAYAAVKKAADDVINKAPNRSDPAIKDIKRKLDKLKSLWDDVQKATGTRGRSLDDALEAAQKFWKELHAIMATLKDLEDSLVSQEPAAVEPKAIQQQQVALQEIRNEIDQTKPEVDQVRASGKDLMRLVGEPDKPEVKKHIEDLDNAWDNITALYAKREENLIDAMEKAMEFHETLQNLLEFLAQAEKKFAKMGTLGTDIDAVKRQIDQLKKFKAEVDPHMVKVEALNRQAQELTERTSADQAAAIKEPLSVVNKRWDDLLRGIVERQRQLENALLRLGQFQHALNELLVWISKTDKTLDELKPVQGDPQALEIELAKLKVLINDIQAHQTSVDTLNDAGRQIIESGEGSDEASITQEKLNTLNTQWRALMRKAADRQRELEDSLNEAQRFNAEIQDLLAWLGDVDGVITASKPVGGLPETASEQLERFMEVYNEIEDNRPKVETVLAQGQEYLKKSGSTASNLQHNLRTLKQRWDSVTARANDKKIKLEIALKEATEFHEALQAFVDWLSNAENHLSSLKPVSRVLDTIQGQIEEHKVFQKDVGAHREIMLNLDKKGTHLKYFSQKQDVILIKNLLISVQHRWERVASKSAERTRALDLGYKEAKEFHDSWSHLMSWLDDTEESLDKLNAESVGNDPGSIKQRLAKHQDFQRALSGKQATYDAIMKAGKQLKDKAPKADEVVLKQMLIDLKNKWTGVCNKSVDRQRKLEEALLYSGQFKDAIAALLQWLKQVEKELSVDSPVHGDLDTVNHLVDQHRQFEKELERRNEQMESVIKTGNELERKASRADAEQIRSQLNDLNTHWNSVSKLTRIRSDRLEEALREAERLHKSVNMLLDWLSEAEMQLRFVGSTPEDEATAYEQLMALDKSRAELKERERDKDQTLDLAHRVLAKAHPDSVNVIKNWIKVIQSRWDEVSQWAMQRHQKLTAHMQSLKDLDECLEELIQWLLGLENTLISLKREELPMDIPATERLIADHKELMENTQRRQGEVDRVCKARQVKAAPQPKDPKKFGAKGKGPIRGSQHDIREPSPDSYGSLGRKQSFKGSRDLLSSQRGSRSSPGRELSPDPQLPHVGPRFPPHGSEPEFRSPRVKFLYDKWRHVWMLSWERQRELYDHLAYLKEKEKADNFSWDDWRKRFLKFMNYKKSRLTDLFRKMDKDNNELIPRDDFIDGIIRTKFDTSRLEMKHVADMFDLDNRGLIDWKKFIAALRPDWEEKTPDNDAQKIHDEVKRLVMLCTCRQKFRVFQVGEGKYRFGESQKLRLVRILRSTVMVRVGGGWVALDEFLVKNDPCRVAVIGPEKDHHRLLYLSQMPMVGIPQIILTPPDDEVSGDVVRERSARSVPMGGSQPRVTKSSLSAGTPDSLSDNEGGTFRTPRRPSYRSNLTPGGSKPNSRPASRTGSRPGSKPPSRHGSNLSLDSTDDGTPSSRIPRRTPVSGRSATTTSSATRRVQNGTPGSRTPSGLISPASPAGRSSGIPRAASIPTLTSVTTTTTPRSMIPVYRGSSGDTDLESPSTSSSCSVSFSSAGSTSKPRQVTIGVAPNLRTASRTRTPSGSNTPVQPGQPTAVSRLLRRPSGASDTPTGQAKKSTTANREPFRL